MINNKFFTYFAFFLSFLPFSFEYLIAKQVSDFAVLDGFTMSFFIFAILLLLSLKSTLLMILVGISTTLLSFILININIEYFAMFHVFISYDVLPLFQDMFRAMVHFNLTPLYSSLVLYTVICLFITLFMKKSKHQTLPIKVTLPIILISLCLGIFTNSLHAKRYKIMPQEVVNGHTSLNYSFESPSMFFLRSLPFSTKANQENLSDTKSFKTVASALNKNTPITLPEKYDIKNYRNLIPPYPGYILSNTNQLTFKHSPNTNSPSKPNKKNIILINLESVRAFETGIVNKNQSLTPNLDHISKQGLSASNAYSTNRVTVKSELSILCSRPDTQDGIPFSIYKAEVEMNCLPKILNNNGYETYWFHGHTKDFFNRGAFLPSLGFKNIYDKDSFIKDGYKDEDLGWGVDDHYFFKHTLQKLEQSKKPFFAELMTLSNHQPFNWDFKNITFPENLDYKSDDIYKNYLRSIYYSDHALGAFYEAFNKSKLKDNTILIITGDHGVPFYPPEIKNKAEQFQILFQTPLIILGQDIKQELINTKISHFDIAPTVLSMLNINEPVMFIGRPILGESKTLSDRPIYLDNMDNFGFIMGELSCIPAPDYCKLSNNQCSKFEDKLCRSYSPEQFDLTKEINPFKNYLSLLLEAGLK